MAIIGSRSTTSLSTVLDLVLGGFSFCFGSTSFFLLKLLAELLHLTLSFRCYIFGIFFGLFLLSYLLFPQLLLSRFFLFGPLLCLSFFPRQICGLLRLLMLPFSLCSLCSTSFCGKSFLAFFDPGCNIRRRLQGGCSAFILELKPQTSLANRRFSTQRVNLQLQPLARPGGSGSKSGFLIDIIIFFFTRLVLLCLWSES